MARIIGCELKKILSLPVLVLLGAALVILAGVTGSRYGSFSMLHGVTAPEYRAMSLAFAGPLDQELADRAIDLWRTLPEEDSIDSRDPESYRNHARRKFLEQLAAEYAAVSGEIAIVAESASWDADQRLTALASDIAAPAGVHGYYEGWVAFQSALNMEAPALCALLVIFGLASLFAGETASGMASLCRTFRYGRWGQVVGKWMAAGIYAMLCAALCALIPLAACRVFFGLEGGSLPAAYLGIGYPLTITGYAGLRLVLFGLGGLGLMAVMAMLSSLTGSSTAAAAAGAAVYLTPAIYALSEMKSLFMDTLMDYMPSRLLSTDPLLTTLQPVTLGWDILYKPQWLAVLWPALILALCLTAGSHYLRTLREEPLIEE